MKTVFRFGFAIVVIWTGIEAIKQSFGGYNTGMLYFFQYTFFALLLVFTLAALLLDSSYYLLRKNIGQYATSIIGLIMCGIVIFRIIQRNRIDDATTVFAVSHWPEKPNVWEFEFKINNQFRVIEIPQTTVYYGQYEQRNDSLFIRNSNYRYQQPILPREGKIAGDTVFWRDFEEMKLVKK